MTDDTRSLETFLETSRRRFIELTGATTVAAAGIETTIADDDPSRTDRLVEDLSLEAKVGQMTQVAIDTLSTDEIGHLFTDLQVGSLLTGGASPPTHDPVELQSQLNDAQEFAMENTDHGIPFAFGIDAVHGNVTVDGATAFPHNFGLGATFDPDLARAVGRATAESVWATGSHWNFGPAADLHRDQRWGRYYEGFSEDPYTAADMAGANVEGLQEPTDDGTRIGATAKHFTGYSEPYNGNDRSPAHIPTRDLRQNHFPPFQGAIGAGTETIMVNSGSVNGVPAHASEYLLTDVLRDEWGFEGVVLSDWDDFQRMVDYHEYVPTFRDAVREGINAGVDMYMEPEDPERFVETLLSLVRDGEVSESRVDEAVRRILRFKERIGLFERPTVDCPAGDYVGGDRDLSERAATESMTLLANDGTLPLSPDLDSVVVAGPSGDSVRNQMGGWTLGWQGLPEDSEAMPAAVTILDAIEDAVDGGVEHVPTDHVWEPYGEDEFAFTDEDRDALEAAAADADAVVLVLGEGPYSEGFGNTNELALPEAQRRLVQAAAETEAPVVGVVVAGRPRGSEETFDRLDAVLMAYLPGTDGGPAVANVLFGEANPSARLPFTWPKSVGQIQSVYNHLPPEAIDTTVDQEPLFPFGHGLSYTEFEYRDLELAPGSLPSESQRGTLKIKVTVENAGDRAGTHIVHAYNTQAYGSVIHPDERLVGYERVDLEPGDHRRVTIDAPLDALRVVPGGMTGEEERLVLEDGKYAISVGDLTETFTLGSGGYTGWEPAEGGEEEDQ